MMGLVELDAEVQQRQGEQEPERLPLPVVAISPKRTRKETEGGEDDDNEDKSDNKGNAQHGEVIKKDKQDDTVITEHKEEYSDGTHTIYDKYEDGKKVGTVLQYEGVTIKSDGVNDPISDLLELSKQEKGKMIYVMSGYRTQEEQNKLIELSKAQKNSFVPPTKSPHTYEVAMDIFIPGYTPNQTANAAYKSKLFKRVSTYRAMNIVHVDYFTGSTPGLYSQWKFIKGY